MDGLLEPDEVWGCSPRPIPLQPTNHLPGSTAKIEVMIRRAELGWELFHAQDRTFRETDPYLQVQTETLTPGRKNEDTGDGPIHFRKYIETLEKLNGLQN